MGTIPNRLVVVVVSHNRRELTLRCIHSVLAQSARVDHLILVDNASTDGTIEAVGSVACDRLSVVATGGNLGASGGFHRGMLEAVKLDASHLVLLDSDVVLDPCCLERLRASLEPGVGVVGPKVFHWDSPTLLQEFGGWIDWEGADLRRNGWRHDEATHGPITANAEVDYVPSCCLLAPRDAVERAGLFDPDWFLYWDDIDWCDRVRVAGFHVRACVDARVQHFGGGANKRNLVPVYYGWRNRLRFFQTRTPSARRERTLQAFFADYLLARWTCRSVGLPRTAAMMDEAIEDALRGITGRRDLHDSLVRLDDPVQSVAPGQPARVARVHHVIGSATPALAAERGLVLEDRFGKRLPAAQAWELRQAHELESARELPRLLARAG